MRNRFLRLPVRSRATFNPAGVPPFNLTTMPGTRISIVSTQLLSPALFRDRNVRVEREGVMAGSRSAGSGQEGQEVAESGKAGAQK